MQRLVIQVSLKPFILPIKMVVWQQLLQSDGVQACPI